MNNNAISEYIAVMGEISTAAQQLTEWAENNGDTVPDAITWGNVGHAQSVFDALRDVLEMIGN